MPEDLRDHRSKSEVGVGARKALWPCTGRLAAAVLVTGYTVAIAQRSLGVATFDCAALLQEPVPACFVIKGRDGQARRLTEGMSGKELAETGGITDGLAVF